MGSYLFPLSLDCSNPSARDPPSGRRAQGNFSNAADSPPISNATSSVFPKQKFHEVWTRSKSIPVPRRRLTKQAAASEIMIAEEEFLADVRDCAMFTRIVEGMARKASFIQDPKCREDIDLCLAHIVATRYLPKEKLDESGSSDDDWAHLCIVARSTMNQDGSPLPVHCTGALGWLGKDNFHALIRHQDDVGRSAMKKDGSPLPVQCNSALGQLRKENFHELIRHTDDEEMIFEMDL